MEQFRVRKVVLRPGYLKKWLLRPIELFGVRQ